MWCRDAVTRRRRAALRGAPLHGDLVLRIAILGLGYVGTTTAACLAKAGHHVLGIDINAERWRPSVRAACRWSSPTSRSS